MIDTKALRNKIIDLAIAGKLTSHETGNVKAEIKKATETSITGNLRIVDNAEKWTEIPDNWEWTTLSSITSNETLGDGNWVLSKDMVPDGDVKLIQLGCIGDCIFKQKGFKYLTEEHFNELNGKRIYPGYLLINRLVVDKMVSCIVPDIDGILCTAVDVCWVAPNSDMYDINYLMYAISTSEFRKTVKELGHGVTRFRISKLNLIDIPFPFPPLAEQKRIVSAVEDAFAVIERIEKAQESYYADQEVLKNKIIDAGIRGKLTEQLPEDGNAEDLYAQIQEEKAKLIAEGKIKKEKPLPPITKEEIPFEIPENWKWARIGGIAVTSTGSTPSKTHPEYYGGSYPFFKPSDLDAGQRIKKASEYLSAEGENVSRRFKKGTILVCCIGSIGKAAIIDVDGTANQQINAVKPIMCCSDYLYYTMRNDAFITQLLRKSRATTIAIVNKSEFDNCCIPLPPFSEQVRIVEEINKYISAIA